MSSQSTGLLVLSGEVLLGLATPLALVDAVEQAIGGAVVPERAHLAGTGSTLLVMPSSSEDLFGVKLVSVAPGNASRNRPIIQGLMLLVDALDGAPVALLDAAVLTCQRTGAVAALGIRSLSLPGIDALGVVGCGVQGAWAAIHAATVRPIRTLFCLPRSEESFLGFRATVSRFAPELEIVRCADASEVLAQSDCVVAATTSTSPVLPNDQALLADKLLVSIGSYRPHMQELPDAAYALAGTIYVDSPHAAHEVGDVINPVARGLVAPEAVIEIGEILADRHTPGDQRCRVFKSVGYGAYDLFAAKLLYRIARERGLGQEIRL